MPLHRLPQEQSDGHGPSLESEHLIPLTAPLGLTGLGRLKQSLELYEHCSTPSAFGFLSRQKAVSGKMFFPITFISFLDVNSQSSNIWL